MKLKHKFKVGDVVKNVRMTLIDITITGISKVSKKDAEPKVLLQINEDDEYFYEVDRIVSMFEQEMFPALEHIQLDGTTITLESLPQKLSECEIGSNFVGIGHCPYQNITEVEFYKDEIYYHLPITGKMTAPQLKNYIASTGDYELEVPFGIGYEFIEYFPEMDLHGLRVGRVHTILINKNFGLIYLVKTAETLSIPMSIDDMLDVGEASLSKLIRLDGIYGYSDNVHECEEDVKKYDKILRYVETLKSEDDDVMEYISGNMIIDVKNILYSMNSYYKTAISDLNKHLDDTESVKRHIALCKSMK